MSTDDTTKVLDDASYELTAFESLEKDFQDVLQELISDKSLQHFRLEYEKLHRALKKSYDSEKRLIKKCRELNSEIVNNSNKVQTAMNLSKEDQATIQSLKKDIEKAWKMVEESHKKEQRAKETIHSLKVEIANLSHLVEQGAGLSVNQENTVNGLISQREDLQRSRDKLEPQVAKMTKDNIQLTETVKKIESEKFDTDAETENVREMLAAKRMEADREMRRKERLEKELQEQKQTLHGKDKQLQDVKNDIKQQERAKEELEKELKDKRTIIDAAKDQEQRLLEEIDDMKRKNHLEEEERKKLHQEKLSLEQELKERQEETKAGYSEKDKLQKVYDLLKRRKTLDDGHKREIELSRITLKAEAENLIREIERLRRQVENDAKSVEDIMRDRDSLNRTNLNTDSRTRKKTEEVKAHEITIQQLDRDVRKVKADMQEAVVKVYNLDKAREKCGMELSVQNAKHAAALEDLKRRDNKNSELRKNLAEVKEKLLQHKQDYEAVRTQRNLFSKQLVESQDEIAEMKRKFKIMFHQIEQQKEEIKELDSALRAEKQKHAECQKRHEGLKEEMENAKKRHNKLAEEKDTHKAEIKKLNQQIHEAETERNNQKRKWEDIITERDILGTQLIRRNDELGLLYEKVKILQRTLQQGEVAYKQLVEESRGLAIKEAALKRELLIEEQQVANLEDLKKEAKNLQMDLLSERTKVKALSEELENPMNVHRWRKLEGGDPAQHEMVQKVTTLQRRLIAKTEELVEKEIAIEEKTKLYLNLQSMLDKQPASEVVEEVGKQQQALKEKTKQMKAMAAELNMYHAQLSDYKDEIDRLTKDLQDTKKRYFEQRHREQLTKEASRPDKGSAPLTQPTSAGASAGLAPVVSQAR